MAIFNKKGVSPVIAIVLLLMMTVAAAGAAYFWITSMQSSVQQSAGSQIEAITKQASTRIIAQATICEGINEVNLKAYWKMDEGERNYANDSSKYENDGTLEDANTSDTESPQGPDWVSGKIEKALDFDGSDDYVEVSNDVSLKPKKTISVSAWFKDSEQGDGWVVAKDKSNNKDQYALKVNDDSQLLWFVGNGSQAFAGTSYNGLIDGNWYHATGTYSQVTGVATLYLNGQQVDESTGHTKEMGDNGYDLYIGARRPSYQHFNGKIDEVRIYDRALSQAQVEYLNDTNKAMGRYVNITVYNAGTEEVPEGAWVANLKKDGTTVDSDSYNASKLPSEERITLNFYFDKMKPNKEYKIELEGTQTSTTVSC